MLRFITVLLLVEHIHRRMEALSQGLLSLVTIALRDNLGNLTYRRRDLRIKAFRIPCAVPASTR